MKASFIQVLKWGAIAAAVSSIINALLFFIFHGAGLISDSILLEPNKEPLSVVPVIFSSIMPSLVATLVYYLIYRFSKNGYKIFTIVSIVLLLLSFMNPFLMIPGVTMAYGIALNLMHVIVAFSLLYFFKRTVVNA